MKKLTLILFIIANLLLCNCFAANHLYQVNLLVFTRLTDQAFKTENWPNHLLNLHLTNFIDLQNLTTTTDFITLLPQNKLGLQNEAYGLNHNSDYKILLRLSWTQPITGSKNGKWIHIFGGQAYDAKGLPIDYDSKTSTTPPAYWQFDGKLKIYRNRYFTIRNLFYLTLPNDLFDSSTADTTMRQFQLVPLRTVTLIKTIRTRLNEINYLDHPLFGVLIQITKITP